MNATADALMGIFAMKRVKPKRCRHCKHPFTPARPLQSVCSPRCAAALVDKINHLDRKKADKAIRKSIRERKEKLKSISEIANEVQTVFNSYIRARDRAAGHGCISCGTKADIQYAAGHYRSRGASSWLRFNEDNVFLQCNKRCNMELGGNTRLMRQGMIDRIGVERVEAIESSNETHKWTRDELAAIKAIYKAKLKAYQAIR